MRTLDLMEYVAARPSGVIAQDIASALDIPVSSLSYLLGTLVERDYLCRNGRLYTVGPALDRLRRPDHEQSIEDRLRPLVKALRMQLNETATFFTRTEWQLEAAINETAEQPLRYSITAGDRAPLHCVAAGKTLLASLDSDSLATYFREVELTRYTSETITTEAGLREQLDRIRMTGIGLTRNEYTPGICGLGIVVVIDDQIVGALGVAVPTSRFGPEIEKRAKALMKKAVADL